MATLMMLAKKQGFDDDPLSAAIKMIVGPEEASKESRRSRLGGKERELHQTNEQCYGALEGQQQVDDNLEGVQVFETSASRSGNLLIEKLRRAYHWCKFLLTTRHRLCPHQGSSCVYYVTRSSVRALAIGYAAQLILRLTSRAPLLWNNPSIVTKLATDSGILKFGLFLSSFSALFKATNCWLRWSLETSKPLNCFIAGLVAGPALLFYPSPTVALYVLWKCLEALFNEAVDNQVIRNKDLCIVILYGLATSQLFYSALMDPRYMKKSYMAFLDRISHHKLHLINRSVLDVFGTEASSGYEDFFPDLHPKFMSRAFLGSVWIWMIEQKFQAKQCFA